jgi:hypothetical protein
LFHTFCTAGWAGPFSEQQRHHGQLAHRVLVHQVHGHLELPAVDAFLRWPVEVELLQLEAVAADLDGVAGARLACTVWPLSMTLKRLDW